MKKNKWFYRTPCWSYALDETGALVRIDDAVKTGTYYCPNCHGIMIPKLGNTNIWHFAHKNTVNCTPESYLHSLAKKRIADYFNNCNEFVVTFMQDMFCAADCPLKRDVPCSWQDKKSYDLKEYYDRCETEKTYAGFVPDICLTYSMNPNLAPVFIEICVTHKSSVEKLGSGFRIIEINVKTEQDLEDFITSCSKQENISPLVRFYNFRPAPGLPSIERQRKINCFFIDSIAGFHFDGNRLCLEQESEEFEKSILSIRALEQIEDELIGYLLYKHHVKLRNYFCYSKLERYKFDLNEKICTYGIHYNINPIEDSMLVYFEDDL